MSDEEATDGHPRLLNDALRGAEASGKVVRGAAVRTGGYVIGALSSLGASVILLRYLGVDRFGAYVAVMSIVSVAGGISDGGLTAVGNRELARLTSQDERLEMVSKLFGMRLMITPVVVSLAVAYAAISGYPRELVLGTAVAGLGWTLFAISASLGMVLSVDLKILALTTLDVIRQVGATGVVVVLVLARAHLVPLLAASIPGGLLAIAVTPALAGRGAIGWPTFRFREWGGLARSSLPIALAAVIGVVYLKFLTVMMFQLTSDRQTGIFGTSARIIEAIGGLPFLAFMVALPVMSLSNDEGRAQLRTILQSMVEVGMVFSGLLATFLFLGAPSIIRIIGGAGYAEAAPVLEIQSFSLVGALLAMACLMAAIAMDLRRVIVIANSIALVSVVVLGIPAILLWGAKGAAVATVVGESAMALTYWLLIGRADRTIQPRLGPFWKAALATAVGIAVPQLAGMTGLPGTAVGIVIFTAVALLVRAVPAEVYDAIRRH